MKRALYLLFVIAIGLSALAQTNQTALVQKLSGIVSAQNTIQCDFVQTKHMKMLNKDMVSKGKMHYKKSDKLKWEYVTPYTYVFTMNANKVQLKKNNRSDVIDVNKNKMFKEIASIMMNSMTGKILSDSKTFKTTIKETSTEWVADMIPQKGNMKQLYQKIVLNISKAQSTVSAVTMYELNGDYTRIDLKNITVNKEISDKVFAIN